jgi:chaperonin cofactor prefoldin
MQTVQAMKVELKKEIMTVVEENESKLKDKLQTNDSHWQEIEERVKELQSSVNASLNKKMSQLVSVESL